MHAPDACVEGGPLLAEEYRICCVGKTGCLGRKQLSEQDEYRFPSLFFGI